MKCSEKYANEREIGEKIASAYLQKELLRLVMGGE